MTGISRVVAGWKLAHNLAVVGSPHEGRHEASNGKLIERLDGDPIRQLAPRWEGVCHPSG